MSAALMAFQAIRALGLPHLRPLILQSTSSFQEVLHSATGLAPQRETCNNGQWKEMHAACAGLRGFASGPESKRAVAQSPEDDRKDERYVPLSEDVEYKGPLSQTHKLLKRVSIGNTSIALAAAPYIYYYGEISQASRIGLASTLIIFGVITTGALHWITHPYVHELKFTAATQMIEVKTTTLLGFKRTHSFHLNEAHMLPWDRPVATFMAGRRFYYIDIYSFPKGDLLKKLSPSDDVPQGYKDDQDDD